MLNATSMAPTVISENTDLAAWSAANLQANTEIDNAVSQYYKIRAQYNEILSEAIHTQDTARRAELVSTITALNQRLTTIVTSIEQMYSSSREVLGSLPPVNFAADLEQYKLDLEELMTERDELSKLKTVYSTLQSGGGAPAVSSYIYIVGILVMLVLLLVMFTFTSLMTNVQAVVNAIPPLPELPSLGLTAPAPTTVL